MCEGDRCFCQMVTQLIRLVHPMVCEDRISNTYPVYPQLKFLEVCTDNLTCIESGDIVNLCRC
jgi:hypothetical protein